MIFFAIKTVIFYLNICNFNFNNKKRLKTIMCLYIDEFCNDAMEVFQMSWEF